MACAAIAGAQSPPETGAIAGSILDRQTGLPLKGAEVCLAGPENPCAITEADGRFEFRVPVGRYTLRASRSGYVAREYSARPEGRVTVLALEPGMRIGDLRVRLMRFSVISGRVVNEQEEPLEGAQVVVWSLPRRDKVDQPVRRVARGATNDLGEYRVAGLSPANYYVSVEPSLPDLPCSLAKTEAREATPGYPKRIYGLTFYPGAVDAAEAVPVRVEAGLDLKGIDFTLLPVRAETVRGRVEMNFEKVASPAIALARPGLDEPARYAQVEPADGSFAFCGVLPGRYLLKGSWGIGGKVFHAREEIETSDAPMGELLVKPAPAAQVAGRIRIEGGGKPDLSHLDAGLFGQSNSRFTTIKPDHSFVFPDVWPGEYHLDLPNLPACCYLKAAELRGQDVLRDGLRVEAGESVGGLELVVATDAPNIVGVVLDAEEKPVPGALVMIEPDMTATRPGRKGTMDSTDQAGGFVLAGVPPGDYRIYAWADSAGTEWLPPDELAALRNQSTTISVPDRAGQPVTVHLIAK